MIIIQGLVLVPFGVHFGTQIGLRFGIILGALFGGPSGLPLSRNARKQMVFELFRDRILSHFGALSGLISGPILGSFWCHFWSNSGALFGSTMKLEINFMIIIISI